MLVVILQHQLEHLPFKIQRLRVWIQPACDCTVECDGTGNPAGAFTLG